VSRDIAAVNDRAAASGRGAGLRWAVFLLPFAVGTAILFGFLFHLREYRYQPT
jgi:hypothetical protein